MGYEKSVSAGQESHGPKMLQHAVASRRMDALFRAMATDFLLREQFVTNPAQIVSEYVHGESPSPQAASVNNQLLYSILANEPLTRWLLHYSRLHHGISPEPRVFMRDLGRAIVEHRGDHVVLAIMRSAVEKEDVFRADSLLSIMLSILARVGDGGRAEGTEMSTGTDFGTQRSGTEMSTGSIFASGTEMSTGTDFGTQRSGTEMSTGSIFASGTEMSTGTDFGTQRSGTEMSTGSIFASGTEISTGTDFGTQRSGTEMSTGSIFASGTDISTGTDFGTQRSGTEISGGVFGARFALSTLHALVQFAGQLSKAGVLNAVGIE